MQTFIVTTDGNESTRTTLSQYGSVGKPSSLHNIIILHTEYTIEQIQSIAGVETVEEDGAFEAGYDRDWRQRVVKGNTEINDLNRTGKGVDIYIIDSGIRETHEDFTGRVETIYSYDNQPFSLTDGRGLGHGTSVASCAAGVLYGVASEANILNLRMNYTMSDIVKCYDVILTRYKQKDNPAVVNMSYYNAFGFTANMNAIKAMADEGIVLVACAANQYDEKGYYPAANEEVISVGAHDKDDSYARFSTYGQTIDIWAPGQSLTVARMGSDTEKSENWSGTSGASPIVAGCIALLLEGSDKLQTKEDAEQVKQHLFSMGTDTLKNTPNNSTSLILKLDSELTFKYTAPELVEPEPPIPEPEEPKEEIKLKPVPESPNEQPEKPKKEPVHSTPSPKKKKDDDKKKKIIIGVVIAIVLGVAVYLSL